MLYRRGGVIAGPAVEAPLTDDIVYRVVAFREGVAVKGDGAGDLDWDWRGSTQRTGDRILRFRPIRLK